RSSVRYGVDGLGDPLQLRGRDGHGLDGQRLVAALALADESLRLQPTGKCCLSDRLRSDLSVSVGRTAVPLQLVARTQRTRSDEAARALATALPHQVITRHVKGVPSLGVQP